MPSLLKKAKAKAQNKVDSAKTAVKETKEKGAEKVKQAKAIADDVKEAHALYKDVKETLSTPEIKAFLKEPTLDKLKENPIIIFKIMGLLYRVSQSPLTIKLVNYIMKAAEDAGHADKVRKFLDSTKESGDVQNVVSSAQAGDLDVEASIQTATEALEDNAKAAAVALEGNIDTVTAALAGADITENVGAAAAALEDKIGLSLPADVMSAIIDCISAVDFEAIAEVLLSIFKDD